MGLDVSHPLSDALIALASGMTVYQRFWLTVLAAALTWAFGHAVAGTGLRVAVRTLDPRGIWVYEDSYHLTNVLVTTIVAIPASVLMVLIWLVL